MTTTQQRRATRAMVAGLLLTVAATIVPFVDRVTSNVLAGHIRNGYPAYTQMRVNSAVDTWLVILSVVGALGVLGWIWTIWSVRTGKRWARPAATGMFVVGVCVAAAGLLVKDTSGVVGLAPLLGWIWMLPSVAGLTAVAMLWRAPR